MSVMTELVREFPESQVTVMETHLSQSTPIYVGRNIVEEVLLQQLSGLNPDRVFIVTDQVVGKLHGEKLAQEVGEHFPTHVLTFPGGEPNKTIATFAQLADEMFAHNVSKGSVIVALGGGIVGNMAGYIAANIFRGIPFIEVPTTFLAQTDSIMSSKQAVNTKYGKNMLGVYYPQYCTIADVRFLLSESERSLRSGLVETVKNGFINDAKLVAFMLKKIPELRLTDLEELEYLVKLSIESKIKIIDTDPTEKHRGMILEYGHTVGHAIEKMMQGGLTHGEGVAIGMIAAAKISNQLGLLDTQQVELHQQMLNRLGVPTRLPSGLTADGIIKVIEHDNKREVDGLKWVILEDIGVVKMDHDKFMINVPGTMVKEVLQTLES